MSIKTFSYSIIFIIAIVFGFSSCKKNTVEAIAAYVPDKAVDLIAGSLESYEDTLYIKRSSTSFNVRIAALTNQPNRFKRLYAFRRSFDGVTLSDYKTVPIAGFVLDGSGNYYKDISSVGDTLEIVDMIIAPNTSSDIQYQDYFFVFTNGNYSNPPAITSEVVIGPYYLNVQNGLMTEYPALRMYNYFCDYYYTPYIDFVTATQYTHPLPDGFKDIMDMDSTTKAFERMFTSKNGTTFIKAPADFNYIKATDYLVRQTYEDNAGSAFTTSPSPVNVGDVYIAKLRGSTSDKLFYYVVLRCTSYFDDGLTGPNNNNDFIQWSLKRQL